MVLKAAKRANVKRGDIPVLEIYKLKNVKIDFIPAGNPQLNPVELLFSYLKGYIADKSLLYNKGGGWTREDLLKVMNEAKGSITYDMVKGWYKRTFTELYPNRKIPIYLRSDISKKKIKMEIIRQVDVYNRFHKSKNISSRGRIITRNKNFF